MGGLPVGLPTGGPIGPGAEMGNPIGEVPLGMGGCGGDPKEVPGCIGPGPALPSPGKPDCIASSAYEGGITAGDQGVLKPVDSAPPAAAASVAHGAHVRQPAAAQTAKPQTA